jgi:hypothetical protein
MKSINTLTFAQRFKIVPLIQANVEPDGPKCVRYTKGFDDAKVAALAAQEIGHPVTAANITAIRREVVGNLRVGGAIAGSGRKSLAAKVNALSAEVAELRRALTAAGIIGLGIAAQ